MPAPKCGRGSGVSTRVAAIEISFAVMAVVGVLLHLGMEALNSYGVHPYWPLEQRLGRTGDSVFIIEPLYWLATAPLFFLMRSVGRSYPSSA